MASAPSSFELVVQNPFARVASASGDLARALATPGRDDSEIETITALSGQVNRFCRAELDAARIDAAGRLPAAVLDGARRLGLFGMSVPVRYGGAGLSMKAVAEVLATLAEHDGSLATTVGLHAGLGLRALVAHGSEALRATWLPRFSGGERLAAFAATEPGAGSDLTAIRTALDAGEEGTLRLSGEKCFVTNGGLGGAATVLARGPGVGLGRGHALVLVDLGARGVRAAAEHDKLGLRGSSTVDLAFDDVHVPQDNLIGADRGMELAHESLAWGRTFLAAGCIGTAQGALALAAAHVEQRHQFGRALGRFELVRATLAGARARLHAMRAVVRLVATLEEETAGSVGWESAAAKVLCSDEGWWIVDQSLQLHGGTGFLEPTGVARRLRDIRVTRIFEGANDVLRLRIAAAALAWPRAGLQTLGPLRASAVELQAPIARIESIWASFAERLVALRARHGARLHEQQSLQWEIAEAVLHLYAALAAVLATEGTLARSEGEARAAAAETGHHAVEWSLGRARSALARLEEPSPTFRTIR